MTTKTIHQKADFPVSPDQFYATFLDSDAHADFTEAAAEISDEPGAAFRVFDGYCYGKNVELIPGKKIVQTWIAEEEYWPMGHESIITLELTGNQHVTHLEFTHEKVPAEGADSIADGWQEYYWDAMREYL